MKLLAYFTVSMLLGSVFTAPTSKDDVKIFITEEFFDDELIIYKAEHDIVNLLSPINKLNFEDDYGEEHANTVLFFVLADNDNGSSVEQGLYIRKHGIVTKLLDNGRDAAAGNDDTNIVYFGAKDGLYSYNAEENKAEKFGNITDSIISVAVVRGSDIIYILTEDHVLYKVTQTGMIKEKIEEAVNAQKIVLDYENNLYYYTADKKVYVLGPNGSKQITGLVEEPSDIDILKPPFIMERGIPVIMDNKVYVVSSSGTETSGFEFGVRPTAYSLEATVVQYFAYKKKIYEYNILNLLFRELNNDIKYFLEHQSENISDISSWLKK